MTSPVRLQLARRKGFDLQALSRATNGLPAVKVTRPGAWGNPYIVERDDKEWFVYSHGCRWGPFASKADASAKAVARFRAEVTQSGPHNHRLLDPVPTRVDIIKALRGRNLACFCDIGAPCHADVLLELANGPMCEAV